MEEESLGVLLYVSMLPTHSGAFTINKNTYNKQKTILRLTEMRKRGRCISGVVLVFVVVASISMRQ